MPWVWGHLLEARRRQQVPASAEGSETGCVAKDSKGYLVWNTLRRILGGCTTKDARRITVWTRFDCGELAFICFTQVFGTLVSQNVWTLAFRISMAIAWVPIDVIVVLIFKRVVHAIMFVQGEAFTTWLTDTASPALARALLLEIVVLLMWVYASLIAPYPKANLVQAFTAMLAEGNSSAVLCTDDAAFQASFQLPFEFASNQEPLECDEPMCGYTSWWALCEARRLAPLAEHTTRIVRHLLFAIPILLFIGFSIIGSGRIARDHHKQLKLAGLAAPHILLIIALGLCKLCVVIFKVAMFLVQVPVLMSGRAPADPLVCMPSSACGSLSMAMYLGYAAIGLLPIDTLGRFLKQRSKRHRSYFLSYKQGDGNDGAVQMLATELRERGATNVWLDKLAEDRSEKGMVEGVRTSDVFVAIVSPAYFESSFCCLEMHTALKEDKAVLVVWNQSKHTVQSALGWLPGELSFLKNNELLPMQEDKQMAGTCADRIIAATAAPFALQPEQVPPMETFIQQGAPKQASGSSVEELRSTFEQRLEKLEEALTRPPALAALS